MKDYMNTPLWNNELPVEERLNYLLEELTLEEKLRCLTTGCPEIARLGIKATYMGGEAAHGIEARHDQAFNAGEPEPTTSFTQPIGMSSSFDKKLIKECGRVVGEEARALYKRNGGGLCRWAPTIDMERDPRWGRTEEAYGEDPCLTGEMASAYIQGMKGDHPFYLQCGATLKHFYANNVEKDRIKISSSLDERNKNEYYLEPFRKAIVEGGAEAVMTSYNEINGVPAIVNLEVQALLKDKWGLPGHVVCDGGDFLQTVNDHKYFDSHAQTLAYGLMAGVDCFTDSAEMVYEAAEEALEKGLITEADIDKSIRNSFRTRIRLGFFDAKEECPYTEMGEDYINNKDHQAICRKMAKEAVVLLKNEDGLLPILPDKTKSIAVVGPLADVWYKDWYCGIPPYHVNVLEGIRNAYPETEISYHSGLSEIRLKCGEAYAGLAEDSRLFLTDKSGAETFIFTDWGCGSMTLVAKSNGKFVTLAENTEQIKATGKEAFGWFVRESWNLTGTGSGALQNGEKRRLISWNGKSVSTDEAGYLAVAGNEEEGKAEAAWFEIEIVTDGMAEAEKLAQKAEKVIVVLGSNPVINSKEEIDRTTLALPPMQQALAERVQKANKDAAVVLITNYPYSINELQHSSKAILCTASGSQELGNGVADILSGKTSPAGRLPMTWYKSESDLPDMQDYDIIKGKRTYQYFDKEVLYPFGYGLSYTTFFYGEMDIAREGDEIIVRIPVTNTGECTGDEVVQLYVHKETSRVTQPKLQLKAFERLRKIMPGEVQTAEFKISIQDLKYYDIISRSMLLEEAEYTFMAGASSADIHRKKTIFIQGEKAPARNPFEITRAALYDDYENCFIHRGTSGHSVIGATCIVPGKPGDNPYEAETEEKEMCRLWYRDYSFSKEPENVRLKICSIESGKIFFRCGEKKAIALIEKNSRQTFEEMKISLPPDFAEVDTKQTITVEIYGKIKLAWFCFE